MIPEDNDALTRNTVFIWVALATGLLLLVPLIAMQFTDEVNWDKADFVVMGVLMSGAGSAFVLASRRLPRRRRAVIGAVVAAAFIYGWAELAVGLFAG